MIPFLVYELNTGRILRTGSASSEELALSQAGVDEGVVLTTVTNDIEFYIDNEHPKKRPSLTCLDEYHLVADGVSSINIQIPVGSIITFNGQPFISDGFIEFSTDEPGIAELKIEPPFPLLDKVVTIHAD